MSHLSILDYGSRVVWRSGRQAVDINRLSSGRLRIGTVDCVEAEEKDELRHLINVAAAQVERKLHTATSMHIREMTIPNMPRCSDPVAIDCEPAWTKAQWDQFVARFPAPSEGEQPSWQYAMIQEISDCFECSSPAEIVVDGCGCDASDKKLAIGTAFKIDKHRRPNRVCLLNGSCSCWPTACGDCDCDTVTIRYLCGGYSPCSLDQRDPELGHAIVMISALLYESPESGGRLLKNADEFVEKFLRGLKYRP